MEIPHNETVGEVNPVELKFKEDLAPDIDRGERER